MEDSAIATMDKEAAASQRLSAADEVDPASSSLYENELDCVQEDNENPSLMEHEKKAADPSRPLADDSNCSSGFRRNDESISSSSRSENNFNGGSNLRIDGLDQGLRSNTVDKNEAKTVQVKKSHASLNPSPSNNGDNSELSSVFNRRRSRGLESSGDATKSIQEFEKRLSEERRRFAVQSSSSIVDEKLSMVLKSRRLRVDTSKKENEAELENEWQIEKTKNNAHLRKGKVDDSDGVVDEQLSQVLKARKERLSVDCSPLGLNQLDRKMLRDRRNSGLSPQNSLGSVGVSQKHLEQSVGQESRRTTPGVTYVGQLDDSNVTSSRRKRLTPNQSVDSSGNAPSGEIDKSRRALRPIRSQLMLRKEKTLDGTSSTESTSLDPQLAMFMKRRQEALSANKYCTDPISDKVSRLKDVSQTQADESTPKMNTLKQARALDRNDSKQGVEAMEMIDTNSANSSNDLRVDTETEVSFTSDSDSLRKRLQYQNQVDFEEPRELVHVNGVTTTSSSVGQADTTLSGGMEADAVEQCETASLELNHFARETGVGDEEEHRDSEIHIVDSSTNCDHESKRCLDNAMETDVRDYETSEISSKKDSALDGCMISSTTGDDLVQVVCSDVEGSIDLMWTTSTLDHKDDVVSLVCPALVTNANSKGEDAKDHNDDDEIVGHRVTSGQVAMPIHQRVTPDTSTPSHVQLRKTERSAASPLPAKSPAPLTDLPSVSRTPIAERLAALQKHGNEDWKRRTVATDSSPQLLRPKKNDTVSTSCSDRSVTIADRLSHLNDSQATWKAKVQDKDSKQFTVEGKLSQCIVVDSPITKASKRPLKKTTSKELESSLTSEVPSSPSSEVASPSDERRTTVKIEIPRLDNESISTFFGPDYNIADSPEKIEVSVDAFDDIFMSSNDILTTTKRIKPPRNKSGPVNPVKRLSQRTDLATEYTEDLTVSQDITRNKSNESGVTWKVQLAPEAKDGLASTEDFNKVSLRNSGSFTHPNKYRPFADIMLIHVKGRRYCQSRLVAPIPQSVNSGDCYVLVTSDCIYLWLGQYSNVIERAKASELASQIHQKHDLGVKSTADLVTINEEKQTIREAIKFWTILGAAEVCSPQAPGKSEEDELYESFISEINKVYKLIGCEKLVEMADYSGDILKYEMLRSKEVYVFDFGGEMYIWTGKHVPVERRKRAIEFVVELWEKNYDYSDFSVNPFNPMLTEETGGVPVKGEKRPKWCVFGKLSQNMETALFKEKFVDWPDASRLIKVKDQVKGATTTSFIGSTSFDISPMLASDETPVSLLLEGSNVGRGDAWIEYEDGLRREFEIITQDVDVWHVSEFTRSPLNELSHGQFHDEDAYVVCWHFVITQITHTLSGEMSRQSSTGRPRCAYFFWHGRHCGVGEKGTSALMTVELDKEKGPHVPVEQGREPPCFLRLFNGNMAVHIGKRGCASSDRWRLYIIRNELPAEAHLWEIPVESRNLRSRASSLLFDCHESSVFIWHGCKSSDEIIDRANQIGAQLVQRCPVEFGMSSMSEIKITEIKEGSESKEFWEAFGGQDRLTYNSLLTDVRAHDHTPRMFHMSYTSGVLEVNEVLNPARCSDDIISPFPFLQIDIYCVDQPALFVVDNRHEVYLWQGWWPSMETEDSENTLAGTAEARFCAARRGAMKATLDYCNENYPMKTPNAYLVHAGQEPKQFTNLFPHWQNDETVVALANSLTTSSGELELVSDVFAKLTEFRLYSWEELKERPLPEGVNPDQLELYLAEEDFEEVTGLTRQKFKMLPVWKQKNIKKEVGLF